MVSRIAINAQLQFVNAASWATAYINKVVFVLFLTQQSVVLGRNRKLLSDKT